MVNADDKARVPNSKNKRTSNQKTKENITQIEVNISVEFFSSSQKSMLAKESSVWLEISRNKCYNNQTTERQLLYSSEITLLFKHKSFTDKRDGISCRSVTLPSSHADRLKAIKLCQYRNFNNHKTPRIALESSMEPSSDMSTRT